MRDILINDTNRVTQLYRILHKTNQQMMHLWLHHTLFTWRWWLGVFFTIAPWILWRLVRPKERSYRLRYVMFFIIMIVSWLDFLGSSSLGLWHYNNEVLPFMPPYIPWDSSIIPVLIALFLEYKTNFNPVLKAVTFGGIFAYIGEPLFIALKMYDPDHWHHYYSFIIMIAIYLAAHKLSTGKNLSRKCNSSDVN